MIYMLTFHEQSGSLSWEQSPVRLCCNSLKEDTQCLAPTEFCLAVHWSSPVCLSFFFFLSLSLIFATLMSIYPGLFLAFVAVHWKPSLLKLCITSGPTQAMGMWRALWVTQRGVVPFTTCDIFFWLHSRDAFGLFPVLGGPWEGNQWISSKK